MTMGRSVTKARQKDKGTKNVRREVCKEKVQNGKQKGIFRRDVGRDAVAMAQLPRYKMSLFTATLCRGITETKRRHDDEKFSSDSSIITFSYTEKAPCFPAYRGNLCNKLRVQGNLQLCFYDMPAAQENTFAFAICISHNTPR